MVIRTWRRLVGGTASAAVLIAAALVGTATAGRGEDTHLDRDQSRESSCAVGQFTAEYFDNVDLIGRPFLTECVENVDFDWGHGRAHPRVPENHFGIRWTADLQFDAGTYRFQASTDDGTRVYVDGELVIEAWAPRPVRTSTAYGYLEAGQHQVVLEYFEQGGVASARLVWERSDNGWFQVPERADPAQPPSQA